MAALFGRDAVVYEARDFALELRSMIVADRGRSSAESRWGADFGLIAAIASRHEKIEKGVLGQAKRGSLSRLPSAQANHFRHQVARMDAATKAIVGLEVPTEPGQSPHIRILELGALYTGVVLQKSSRTYETALQSKNPDEPPVLLGPSISIVKYLHAELLRCLHGDLDQSFVRGLADSSVACLRIEARTFG